MTQISSDEGAPEAPSSSAAPAIDEGDQSAPPLALCEGLELIGLFEGSGYKEPPYIARRADGQTLQLSHLLYLVAEAVERNDTLEACAEEVSEGYGRPVSAENIQVLVEEKLRPLGVVVDAEGQSPDFNKGDPLLALTYRAGLVDEGVVRTLSAPFRPLFNPVVMAIMLAGLLAVDAYVFGVIGVGDGLREALYEPSILLAMLTLVVLSAAFHEFGHAAATAAGGASPGKMGAGLYLVWPVFYTDVTDAYRLPRWRRVIVDLGGVYFNALVVLATFGAYLATGWEPLLLLILIQHLEMLHQFLPFVRLDGYYVVSDVTGVPDLFPRIKPILISLLPWRDTPDSVRELKPWVRVVVTIWVVLVVPVLIGNLFLMAFFFPRILATTWDSALIQWDAASTAIAQTDVIGVLASVVQVLILLLPVAGIPLIFIRLGRRVTKSVHSRIADSDLSLPTGTSARAGLSFAGVAAIALIAFVAWPNGDYTPLQEGERLNGPELASSFRYVSSGRPGFSAQRQSELGEVTTQRDARRGATEEPSAEPTAAPSAVPSASASASASASPSPSDSPSPSPSASPSPTPSTGAQVAPTRPPGTGSGTSGGTAGSGSTSAGSTATATPTATATASAAPTPAAGASSSPAPTPTPSSGPVTRPGPTATPS